MRTKRSALCAVLVMLQIVTSLFISPVGAMAAGETEIREIVFKESGVFVVPTGVESVEVLVVGGGGSGGASVGGGGGGGGVRYETNYPVVPGETVLVTVGLGGTSVNGQRVGNSGGSSSFGDLTAIGGGGGGCQNYNGLSGGSGGGCGTAYPASGGAGTEGQGYAGGSGGLNQGNYNTGGGGGAGGAGGNPVSSANSGGVGGPGRLVMGKYYGGGGGGSTYNGTTSTLGGIGGGGIGGTNSGIKATNGEPNTGGGGGAGAAYSTTELVSGAGGSGVVIVVCAVKKSNNSIEFTASGTFAVPENVSVVEVLAVGGGGGGGKGSGGGGGGGGGVVYTPAYTVIPGATISVIVGEGGLGSAVGVPGSNGGNSEFGLIVAIGGGVGASESNSPVSSKPGGSGGGGSYNGAPSAGTAGQGNAGGSGASGAPSYWCGGGGGGAGGAGQPSSGNHAGDGGVGIAYLEGIYGGGGGGGVQWNGTPGLGGSGGGGVGGLGTGTGNGSPGTANTGGGGGGGGVNTVGAGGNGGSGIVIVKWYASETGIFHESLPQPAISSIAMDNQAMVLTLDSASAPELEYSMTVNGVAIGADGLAAGAPVWYKATSQTLRIIAPAISEKLDLELKVRDGDGTESIPLHLENLQELAGIMSEVKGLRGKAGTDSIRLEWLPVKGAQGYEIEMDGAVLTPNPPITEAFHLFAALEPDKSHSFRIRPVKGGISGPWSGLLTVRTTKPVPGEVGTVNAVKGNHWIALSWTAATNAWSYEVELDGELRAAGSSLSLKAEALPQNSVHTVRVRGLNRDGAGPWSPLQYIWTENRVPGSVENLRAIEDNQGISLIWDKQEDAEQYRVILTEWLDNSQTAQQEQTVSGESIDFSGLLKDRKYNFTVAGINPAGTGTAASASNKMLYAIPTPVIQWVDAENEDLIIQWELVTDAFKYEIQQDGVIIGDAVRNWYKIPFSDAETHVYRVRGKTVEGGYSNWSEAVESKPVPKRPYWVDRVLTGIEKDSVTLSWAPVAPKTEAAEDAIRGYDVEVDGYIIQTTDTTYRHDNLQPYTDHRYRVRAVTANRDGFWTDFYRIKTPAALLARIYEIRVKSNRHTNIMSWDPVEGAQWYEVEADGKVIKGYSAEWFEQHGVTELQEHTYRVRACNRYVNGPWSRFVINNAIQAQVKKGEELELGLTATDMTQFSKYRLEVYYPSVLRVEDLCAYTGTKELSSGMIAGTDIEIVNHSPGRVEFIVHKNIDEGTSWTGIINNIVFKGVETGGTTLTYTVHDIEGENEPEKPHDLSTQEKINFEKANPYAVDGM